MFESRKNNSVIRFDDYTSFPPLVVDFIKQHKHLLISKQVKNLYDFEFEMQQKKNDNEIIEFMKELAALLGIYIVECYHITKSLSEESFYKYGIKVLSKKEYVERMRDTFNCLPLSYEQRRVCLRKIQEFVNCDHRFNAREGVASLFAPAAKRLLEEYVDLYASIIGGEIARLALINEKSIYKQLMTYGKTFLIRIEIPFGWLMKKEIDDNFDDCLVMFLYSVLHYEKWIQMEEIKFVATTDKDIPSKNIKSVEVLTFNQFSEEFE